MNCADIIVPSNKPNEVSIRFVVQNLKAQLNGISRLKSYFTHNLFYNADLFTNVWLTPFSQKDHISVFCEISYYLKNKLIFERDEIQKQLIKNYLSFFLEIFDLKFFRRIIKYFLLYGVELLKKYEPNLNSFDFLDLNNEAKCSKEKTDRNVLIIVPFLGNHNFLRIIDSIMKNEGLKYYRKVFFLNVFSTMKCLLQLTKMAANFYAINITCLSHQEKFSKLIKEKCLDKKVEIMNDLDSLDRYYKHINKKIAKIAIMTQV